MVYVADIIFMAKDVRRLLWFEEVLKKKFQVKLTASLSKYIGFELQMKNGYTLLNCAKMIEGLAVKFGLKNLTPVTDPF